MMAALPPAVFRLNAQPDYLIKRRICQDSFRFDQRRAACHSVTARDSISKLTPSRCSGLPLAR